jgi:hypothetical protein
VPRDLLLTTIALVVSVFGNSSVFAQGQKKTIEWTQHSVFNAKALTEPDTHMTDQIDEIEIEAVTAEGQTVTIGEPFFAGDWLKNIVFRVRNISDKQIKNIQITLVLPEMTSGSPQIPFLNKTLAGTSLLMAPGSEVDLRVPAIKLYPWVVSKITEQGSLGRISRAQIYMVYLALSDGTVWSSGCMKTADLRNACPRPSPKLVLLFTNPATSQFAPGIRRQVATHQRARLLKPWRE